MCSNHLSLNDTKYYYSIRQTSNAAKAEITQARDHVPKLLEPYPGSS
jgi:hypothetical protein